MRQFGLSQTASTSRGFENKPQVADKRRSLFLLNSLEIGGSEKKIVRIANWLWQRGWPLHLAYLNAPHTLRNELDPRIPLLHLNRSSRFDRAAGKYLSAYVRREGIETIHCINRYPTVYGNIAAKHPGGYTVFLNSTNLLNWYEEAKMAIYWPLLRKASRIIFGCRYQRQLWIKRYRLNESRCEYIYNGVDTYRFDETTASAEGRSLREQLGWLDTDVVVGMVGQLRAKKGYPDFISAIARLRDRGLPVKGLIIGDGPEREKLQKLVEEKRQEEDIVFLGATSDVRPPLCAMDVFVLTSVASETFSNAALEAMAMGRPVVLSDLGGAREMVEEGVNGFVYPVGDVEQLVDRLMPLVTTNDLRLRLGTAARRLVVERFGQERMMLDYEKILMTA